MDAASLRAAFAAFLIVSAATLAVSSPALDGMRGLSIDIPTSLAWRLFGNAHSPEDSAAVVVAIDEETFRTPPFEGTPSVTWTPEIAQVLSAIIEGTDKALLFRAAGPERLEIAAKTAGNRKRLAAAFDTTEQKLHDEYFKRLSSPQPLVEVPSGEAPVHAIKITGRDVDLTRLPFHPQHALDGSCYLSSAIDYTIDPLTGRRNVGCRRLSLRNRSEAGTNVTAPSDLKRIYTACAARRERLPVTFTIGGHPLDFVAATTRQPVDELALIANFRGEPAPVP